MQHNYALIKTIEKKFSFKAVETYNYLNLSKELLSEIYKYLTKYSLKSLFIRALEVYNDIFLEYYITNPNLDISYTYGDIDIVYVAIFRKNYSLLRKLVRTNNFYLRNYISLVLYIDDPEIVKILKYYPNNITYLSYLQWNYINKTSNNIININSSYISQNINSNIFRYFYELQTYFNARLFFLVIKRKDFNILEDMLQYANDRQILDGINDTLSFGYKDEFNLLVSYLDPKINFYKYINKNFIKVAIIFSE